MSELEDLKKRKSELETVLQSLHKAAFARNGVLASVEKLAVRRVLTRNRTLLNPGSRGEKINFMRISARAIELECKLLRRCLFFLRTRGRNLRTEIEEIENKIKEIEGAQPAESA